MFKKLINYYHYLRTIKKNWVELKEKYALTRSVVGQFGTVINVPPQQVAEYGDAISRELVRTYVNKVDNDMLKLHIKELVVLRKVKKIDSFNYLIVFDFYGFNTHRVFFGVSVVALVAIITALLLM